MQCFYRMVITLNRIKKQHCKYEKKIQEYKGFQKPLKGCLPSFTTTTTKSPLKKSNSCTWTTCKLWATICKVTQCWGTSYNQTGGPWKNNGREFLPWVCAQEVEDKVFLTGLRHSEEEMDLKTQVPKSSQFLYHTWGNNYRARLTPASQLADGLF